MADPLLDSSNAPRTPVVINEPMSDDDRFRLIQSAVQIGTWELNLATGTSVWSDQSKTLFGLSPASATPVSYELFLAGVHPDDRDRVTQATAASLRPDSPSPFQLDYRIIGLDDRKLRWIRATGYVFRNEQDQAERLVGTVIDITPTYPYNDELERRVSERTQALQEALHAKEQQETLVQRTNKLLNQVLEDMPINTLALHAVRDETGIIVDFRIQFVNSLSAASMGVSKEIVIGQLLSNVAPDVKATKLFTQYVRTVESGQLERNEIRYDGREGGRWYDVSSVRQDDGVLVMYLNITDRKQAEQYIQQQTDELQRSNIELRQSNENLQQFAQVASHDLQEPLRRIQAFSDILQNQFEDNLSDGERDMIRRIQKSAGRMQHLIKDLLVYSRLATHRDPFELIPLADVLADVRNDLEMVISEKQARIQVGPLPTVMGNDSRLRQLFQNLIANALKFQQPGQQPIINIQARPAPPAELPDRLRESDGRSFWLVTVADNGLGFDEKYKDRIFTPFQRLHDGAAYSGTGIGLAICYRVTESHGGAIDVSSQPGMGATFKVFLPM